MTRSAKARLTMLVARLMNSFRQDGQHKDTHQQSTGRIVYDKFDQKPAKTIVDDIDCVMAER